MQLNYHEFLEKTNGKERIAISIAERCVLAIFRMNFVRRNANNEYFHWIKLLDFKQIKSHRNGIASTIWLLLPPRFDKKKEKNERRN